MRTDSQKKENKITAALNYGGAELMGPAPSELLRILKEPVEGESLGAPVRAARPEGEKGGTFPLAAFLPLGAWAVKEPKGLNVCRKTE